MLVETLINPLFCAVRHKMLCDFCDFPYNIAYLTALLANTDFQFNP